MADLPPYPGRPRWVNAAGIVIIALLIVFAARHLASGGLAGHLHR